MRKKQEKSIVKIFFSLPQKALVQKIKKVQKIFKILLTKRKESGRIIM